MNDPDIQNESNSLRANRLIEDGYLPLRDLAGRYGYTKYHLSRLSKSGRIEAIRCGSKGEWYVKEESLKTYSQSSVQNRFQDAQTKPPQKTVLSSTRRSSQSEGGQPVLFNNKGSLNAEPKIVTQRGTRNATSGLVIFLSGILFLIISPFFIFDVSIDFKLNNLITSSYEKVIRNSDGIKALSIEPIKNKALAYWDKLRDLFSTEFLGWLKHSQETTPSPRIIEKTIVRQIYEQEPSSTQRVVSSKDSEIKTQTIKQIIREIQSLPSLPDWQAGDTLASLDTRISDLGFKIENLKLEFTRVPTLISLPPSNTKGIGNITLNPQKVDTETLSVSSSATLSSLTVDNNATISGNLTVTGASSLTGSSSISGSFELTSSSSRLGINPGNTTNTMFEVGGTASISGALTLNSITYTFPSTQTANKFLQTDGSGTLSWATAGVSSNSLDFDEFVDTMLLDTDLTINRGGYKIGIGSSPSTVFEVQGTASASYLLTGNTLQVGGFASAAYSRFGTNTTTHAGTISDNDDLLISGGFEVNGSSAFDGFALFSAGASISTNFEITGNNKLGINAGPVTSTTLEVGGTASISGALTLRGVTYTLPSADGTSGQVLSTDGAGTLSWTTKTEGISQDFKGLSLRTSPDADVAATTVTLDHADEIVMDTGNRVSTWDDLSAVITTAGAGGLDTGSEAASTWYEIYAIRKSSDGTKNLLLHRAKNYGIDQS